MTAISSPNGAGAQPELPPDKPDDLFDELIGRIPEIRAELAALDDRADQHRAVFEQQMREISDRKKKIGALLKALGEDLSPRKRATRTRGPGATSNFAPGVPNRVFLRILNGLLALEDDFFTALGLHAELQADWAEPQTYTALKFLREQEFIGLKSPRGNGERSVFRKLNPEIGIQLREQLLAKMEEPSTPVQRGARQPSANEVKRLVEAADALGRPEFAAADVVQQLGHKSPKSVYATIRSMRSTTPPMIEEVGKTEDESGRLSRTTYRLTEAAHAAR